MHESHLGQPSDETDQTLREMWDMLVEAEANGTIPEGLSITELHDLYRGALEGMLRLFRESEAILFGEYKKSINQTLDFINEHKSKMAAIINDPSV